MKGAFLLLFTPLHCSSTPMDDKFDSTLTKNVCLHRMVETNTSAFLVPLLNLNIDMARLSQRIPLKFLQTNKPSHEPSAIPPTTLCLMYHLHHLCFFSQQNTAFHPTDSMHRSSSKAQLLRFHALHRVCGRVACLGAFGRKCVSRLRRRGRRAHVESPNCCRSGFLQHVSQGLTKIYCVLFCLRGDVGTDCGLRFIRLDILLEQGSGSS